MQKMITSHSTTKRYYEEINLFRGLAIFSIVLGHVEGIALGFAKAHYPSSWTTLLHMCEITFGSAGSWYFVFISGFLFYPVFYSRGVAYPAFLKDKFLKVFLPYFIFATIQLVLFFIFRKSDQINSEFIIYPYFYQSFWYIPFICFVFIASPAFETFINLQRRWKILVLLFLILISLGLGKHPRNPVIQGLYYAPAYLLGIIVSLNYDAFMNINWKNKFTLGILYLVMLTCLVALGWWGEHTYGTWDIKFYSYFNGNVLIKLMASLLFVWALAYIKKFSFYALLKTPLNLLARYSFTIFFFQNYVIFYFSLHPHKEFFASMNFWQAQIFYWLAAVIICFTIIAIFAPIKRLLGKYSRYIIAC